MNTCAACCCTAPLAAPKDVTFFLASYARDARARIEHRALPGLATVRTALEDALGLRFEGEKGDHFFRSTLVQTLFYGVFSAWVLWSKGRPLGDKTPFDWRTAAHELHVPAIQVLFEQVSAPSRLGPLGLDEVLNWTGAALNRVDRASFFARFEEDHAVQYFYEPFLEAFDPELRKNLGVWYTPTEVVRYMVARVDTVLRQELSIADGLADPRVHVLDPCTGTGSYLVEVLKRIAETLRAKGDDALLADDLKRAAIERIHGFEILPAPFVVAHLQLGLLLQSLGAPFSDAKHERASVYLTNALTGWDPPTAPKAQLLFAQFQEERDAAEHVKQAEEILVVLGNPPYNGFAGVAVAEERDLSNAYRIARATKQPQGQGLNDLYVRFYRMAERRIIEISQKGVVCFISNYSWLDGLSFTAMRERYLDVFDHVWIDNLNGDKYKTGKLTPEGESDPSIFSTERNREGIQVGTAIALLVRQADHARADAVNFRNLWGKGKLTALNSSVEETIAPLYELIHPSADLGLPFMPMVSESNYLTWPLLPQVLPQSFPGIQPSRDDVVIDIDRDRLVERMEQYFDPAVSHEVMRRLSPGAMETSNRFKPVAVRDYLRKRGFLPDNVVRYCYRPFDLRWLYWEPETDLLDRKREDYFPHVFDGNLWIGLAQRSRKNYDPPLVAVRHTSRHIIERGANLFPLWLNPPRHINLGLNWGSPASYPAENQVQPNMSDRAFLYLRDIGAQNDAANLFFHAIAVLHASAYRQENIGALRQDWPRLPLPNSRRLFLASATFGRQVAAVLDAERPIAGVSIGTIRRELRPIAVVTREGGGTLDPSAGDLALTVGWGHRGQGGVTMPGRGKLVERDYEGEERAALLAWGNPLGLSSAASFAPLGETTYDVYLNDRAYWRNVPARVWEYTIGGYQVMKKWLSYREQDLLGRALTADEAREVMHMARRIAAILLLEPKLDANYRAVKAETYDWKPEETTAMPALRLW